MREDPETFRDFHHGGAQTLTLSAYFIIGRTTALAVCIFHHKLSTRWWCFINKGVSDASVSAQRTSTADCPRCFRFLQPFPFSVFRDPNLKPRNCPLAFFGAPNLWKAQTLPFSVFGGAPSPQKPNILSGLSTVLSHCETGRVCWKLMCFARFSRKLWCLVRFSCFFGVLVGFCGFPAFSPKKQPNGDFWCVFFHVWLFWVFCCVLAKMCKICKKMWNLTKFVKNVQILSKSVKNC